MKKKEYIAPNCEVMELETVNMFAGSFDVKPGETEEEENDPNQMSNRHRGQWGDLWADHK